MIVDLDGLGVHQVTPNGMIIQCCPRWSPDRSRILFEDPHGSLWLINPDGSNLSEIFDGGADNGDAVDPAWSPDDPTSSSPSSRDRTRSLTRATR